MSKLFKLQKWVTVADAAQRLSTVWSETVSEADVLRLALDGNLTLSVNFVFPAWGVCGRRVPRDQTQTPPDSSQGLPITDEVELVNWKAGDVTGVCDLLMVGAERLEVERRYHRLTDGPDLKAATSSQTGRIYAFDPNRRALLGSAPTYGYGVFVIKEDGTWCRLDRWGTRPGGGPESVTEPALELPDGADLVVRTAVLEELARRILTLPDEKRPTPAATEPPEIHTGQAEPASEIESTQEPPGDLAPLNVAAHDLGSDSQARSSDFSWQNVTIRFTSDRQVQIVIDGALKTAQTFGDLGFADGRTTNPNFAWQAFQELARRGGTIDSVPKSCLWAKDWPAVEKRMEEVRKTLCRYFNTDADPVPFKKGIGYKTAFRIDPGSAFDTDSSSAFGGLY